METKSVYQGKRHGRSGWAEAVKTWFRRSGAYLRLAEEEIGTLEEELKAFRTAFTREELEIVHLAPLEYVYFEKDEIDFGSFKIAYSSPRLLDEILDQRTRSWFYRWALIPTADLSAYWWILAPETQPIPPIGNITVDLSTLNRVPRLYSNYELPIERALESLVLYRWIPDWNDEDHWTGFEIPFALRADNYP
jgi:hypothetical protein